MRKWIAAAALVLLPCTAEAQYFEHQTEILTITPAFYTGLIRFRNTQGYEEGTVRALTGLSVTAPGWRLGYTDIGTEGKVFTGTLDAGKALAFQPLYFNCSNIGGVSTMFCGSPSGPFSFVNGMGLLGCTIPVFPTLSADTHSGVTCGNDFGGWRTISFRSDFVGAPFEVDPASVSVTPFFTTGAFAQTRSIVPEPSTYALMTAGLLALGATARRRRA